MPFTVQVNGPVPPDTTVNSCVPRGSFSADDGESTSVPPPPPPPVPVTVMSIEAVSGPEVATRWPVPADSPVTTGPDSDTIDGVVVEYVAGASLTGVPPASAYFALNVDVLPTAIDPLLANNTNSRT